MSTGAQPAPTIMRGRGRRTLLRLALIAAAALAVAVPVALAATPTGPAPGQRIDLRVLVLAPSATDDVAGAWKAALEREGVPYDVWVSGSSPDLTDAALADYGARRARYQAVILAAGDMPLSPTAQQALARLQTTFGIRRISDNTYPSPVHGLNWPAAVAPPHVGEQGGTTAMLTEAGRRAFPELKGPVPIAAPAYGYRATPLGDGSFTTLLEGPGDSALLGVHTFPDGREELVSTVPGNQYQSHHQLLRHGMLNWVTRGVYLGHQRNYLELHVDDVFVANDTWDTEANATSYDPQDAVRMDVEDADRALAWSKRTGLRLDLVFNGGGSEEYEREHGTPDPLLARLRAARDAFGWINHTWDHPNLDCSTRAFIRRQITDNTAWARAQGLAVDPSELVTGEHSGLANSRPGNPGTIDPPAFSAVTPSGTGGAMAGGALEYAVSATSKNGETVASVAATTVAAGGTGSVALRWDALCHATGYRVYRRASGTQDWRLVGSVAQPRTAFRDDGPVALTFTDRGAAGTAQAPPTVNGATLDPYPQNRNLIGALLDARVHYLAADASKTYPRNPLLITGEHHPAGAVFLDGLALAVPRYPMNVYYNVATQAQQLDEYNWLYTDRSQGGGCTASATTTCIGPVDWATYVGNEATTLFGHVLGNDPRPHYVHQSNLAQHDPALPATHPDQGGTLYPVVDALLERYDAVIDRETTPLVQLTQAQIGQELVRQAVWRADVAAGRVSAYLQDGQVHIRTTRTMQVPVTGTTVGSRYGGQTSGWTTVAASRTRTLPPSAPASTAPAAVSGAASTAPGAGPALAGTGAGDVARRAPIVLRGVRLSPGRFALSGARAGAVLRFHVSRRATLRLSVQRLVAGRRVGASCLAPSASNRGGRPCRRAVTVAVTTRAVGQGPGRLRLRGRVAGARLRPGAHRLVVTASDGAPRGVSSAARTLPFSVLAR